MGKRSEVPVTQRRDAVLSLLRREEPGAVIARQYSVAEATLDIDCCCGPSQSARALDCAWRCRRNGLRHGPFCDTVAETVSIGVYLIIPIGAG